MTKDRLGDLQKIAKTKPVDRTSDVEMGGENDSLALSHFLAQVADARLSIDDVDSTVADIKRIHADILSSLTNDNDLRATLEKKLESIKASSKEAKAKLKSLEAELVKSKISLKSPILSFGGKRRKSSADSISTADHIKRTQYNALIQRFSAVMSEYNQVQVTSKTRGKRIRDTLLPGQSVQIIVKAKNDRGLGAKALLEFVPRPSTATDPLAYWESAYNWDSNKKVLCTFVEVASEHINSMDT